MPGIAGIVTDGFPLDHADSIIETLKEIGRIRGVEYHYDEWVQSSALILNTRIDSLAAETRTQAYNAQRQVLLFLEGKIFNVDELRSRVSALVSTSDVASLLLALYVEFGDEFIEFLNGEYNLVIFHGLDKRLVVFSDHIASKPFYYAKDRDRLVFASEKKYLLPLIGRTPEIDGIGLLQIVAHRYNLDERTFLSGIRRMMPATKLSYKSNHLTIRPYGTLRFSVPYRRRKASDLIVEWGDILRTATVDRLRNSGSVILSLSGGLDSRAIAAAIPRNFRPLLARTGGFDNSPDVQAAKLIAARLGFQHIQERPGDRNYSDILAKIVWRTECETHFMNATSIAGHARIREFADCIAGGWLGDVSSGGHIPPELLFYSDRTRFIEKAFRRHLVFDHRLLARVFSEDFVRIFYPSLWENFHSSFGRISRQSNIQLYETWDLYQRQRRQTTSSMPVDSYLFEKVRPFYDRKYLEFTMTLPTQLRFGQSLYQAMIHHIGPEIRCVPSANNHRRLRGSVLGNMSILSQTYINRVFSQANRKLHQPKLGEVPYRVVDKPADRIRADLKFRSLIEEFVGSAVCDPAIFNKPGIRELVRDHYEGNADFSMLLGYIATFSVGLPYFLKQTRSCPAEAEPLAN